MIMSKPKHNWERVYIKPELNGVDPDTGDARKYFDIWTQFQRCTNCGRVESVDVDGTHMPDEDDAEEYQDDGWFVTFDGDTDKCEQEVTIGYNIYWVEDSGWSRRVEVHNSPASYSSKNCIPPFTIEEFLSDLVTEEVASVYWRKKYGKNE